MKKALKVLLAIVATPVVLFLLLAVLLYLPPVQRWAVGLAADYASESTGMTVTVEGVRLSFPLDLDLRGFRAVQPNDSITTQTDTVADVRSLVASVELWPLLRGQVNVDRLDLNDAVINTTNFIPSARIKGKVGRLSVESRGIDLPQEHVTVDKAVLSDALVDIALSDTVPPDTSESKSFWKVDVALLQINKTDVTLHTAGDTMAVRAVLDKAEARRAYLGLHDNIYKVGALDWNGGLLQYDQNFVARVREGFDANHILLNDLHLGLDSLAYVDPNVSLKLRAANFHEQSGFVLRGMSGTFRMDSTQLALKDFRVLLPNTDIRGDVQMALNAFADTHPGKLSVSLDGHTSLADYQPFLVSLPQNIRRALPDNRIDLSGRLEGNLQQARLTKVRVSMERVADLTASGTVANILDLNHLLANIQLKGQLKDLSLVRAFLPKSVNDMVRLPKNIGLNGTLKAADGRYSGSIATTEGGGSLVGKGFYDTRTNAYQLKAQARRLHLDHFLPNQGLRPFTGEIALNGHGTDFLSPSTGINLTARIDEFQYQGYKLDHIQARGTLRNGLVDAHVVSKNAMLGGDFDVKGKVSSKSANVSLLGRISNADLRTLGGLSQPWSLSTDAKLTLTSDMKSRHTVKGSLMGLNLTERTKKGTTSLVRGDFDVDGAMAGNALKAHLSGLLADANLHGLGVMDKDWHVSTRADIDLTTDMKSNHTVSGHIGEFQLNEHREGANVLLAAGDFDLNAAMRGNNVDGTFDGLVSQADLYQMGAVASPMSLQTGASLTFRSNLKDLYDVRGSLSGLTVNEKGTTLQPGDVTLDVLSTRDTTHAVVQSGDFLLDANAQGGYERLMKAADAIQKTVAQQLKDKNIDHVAIREQLPTFCLKLNSGRDNFFCHLLQQNGIAFREADIDLDSSPLAGLNGTAHIDSLVYNDSLTLDHIQFALVTEGDQLGYKAAVENKATNAYPYKGYLNGIVLAKGLQAKATVLDKDDKTGLDVGLQALMKGEGIEMSITSPRSVLGYKEFAVNDGNYVFVGQDRRVSARMRLQADDGAGVQIYSNDEDTTSLQNVTLSMNDFELGKVMSVLPFLPQMSGVLNGDYHIMQTTDELTVSSDMTIDNFVYEQCPMGNIGTNLVYIPKGDGTHFVDAIITKDDYEVGQLTGSYDPAGKGMLDADFKLDQFPLNFVNGFVPDRIIGLRGTGDGELTVKGPLDALDIDGEVYVDSSYLYSDPYGVEMRFADDPVTIKNSRLLFENFQMFANNDQPLNINGYLDFANLDKMMLDVRMQARNFELIDAKENPRSEAYGKAFVNFFGAMVGPLDQLRMGGRLEVLGNTDMTYVMRETALSTDDQLDQLVQFTNFNDSTADRLVRPTPQGFQMDMSISIDEQAHIVCALNAEHTNYIDLIGGGDLTMHYDAANSITLNGRYTLNSGQMKYSLDMIPLRTFNIQQGSYIEFTGDPMNPTLSITATENIKANYSGGLNDRIVNFTAGVNMTNSLSNPTVEFIVDAPEDLDAQNNLNTMSTEEKGKIAVTLLASGMYLADGSGNGFAMNSALASFMQSKINDISGRALSSMGLDLTANMESTADATGALHTDYTFNFSKRLWNNRLSINMGGRVSTGSEATEDNGAYFDNFSMEYRLNKNETQYLKLYYEREAYDWLEGQLSEFGGGFLWRRKLQHFKDIFRWKSSDDTQPPALRDSTQNK